MNGISILFFGYASFQLHMFIKKQNYTVWNTNNRTKYILCKQDKVRHVSLALWCSLEDIWKYHEKWYSSLVVLRFIIPRCLLQGMLLLTYHKITTTTKTKDWCSVPALIEVAPTPNNFERYWIALLSLLFWNTANTSVHFNKLLIFYGLEKSDS